MFSHLSSQEKRLSSASAHHTGSGGRSLPSPQTLSGAPIQFTLEDAQRKWDQWYRSPNVEEEKIRQYIQAKKRGWAILKRELNKEPVQPEGMIEEVQEEHDENSMQVTGEQGHDMQDEHDENSMQVTDDQPDFQIHPDDQETYDDIVDKQSKPISERSQKLETDIRKFNAVAIRSGNATKDGHHQVAIPLNTFFKKNAPPGYNTSSENEKDDDQEEETEGNTYQYDVQYERDFSFGLSGDPLNKRREKTDYFRAPFAHKHVLRETHEKSLSKYLKTELPHKSKEIGGKQVYVSFYVEEAPGNKLKITGPEGSYDNEKMLGSRSGKTVVQRRINVAGHQLILWVNADSAGHQSRYNASAIVPNLVQYEQIMSALKMNSTVDVDPSVNIEEKSFRSDTRKAVLGTKPEALPSANYKQEVLDNRRQLVTEVSNTINTQVKNQYMRAITSQTQQDFIQYPCLVLEPLPNYTLEFGGLAKEMMDELKKKIVFTFHNTYSISFANRASFGFAYPTVGDVGVSIRIWPGLIPSATFSHMILKVLKIAGLLDNKFENKFDGKEDKGAPLVLALKLAIIRAKERFRRYQEIKQSKGSNNLVEKDTYKWVNNRITSNVIKAETLVIALAKKPGDLDLIKRAIRTLENLNEYEQVQAGVEEQQHEGPEPERKLSLSTTFKLRSVNRTVQDYELVSETICSSGMDAYRKALETIGHTQTDSSRLYFETSKVNKTIANNSKGLVKSGSVTKMQDPSYNFVSHKDLTSDISYEWEKDNGYPGVHIYDLTNTPIDVAISKASPGTPSVIVLFESLSKHFQFGMDKTTIGRLIVYVKTSRKNQERVTLLTNKFKQLQDAPMPNYFLNHMALQNDLFGE
ncbi:hypothetical protein [Pedobacter nutrimenti]|uniref:Uncharacterized protein n=1 Tax=Pedobacter nutrimenti TaxID=1241337 RepID=A0A318ULR7_9SPHI|nr:hypothetical protein [Pedobacter nutrimenti]PYF77416.1 hypothetical protein B0O44_101898 [Pedobacter nutrimenti]